MQLLYQQNTKNLTILGEFLFEKDWWNCDENFFSILFKILSITIIPLPFFHNSGMQSCTKSNKSTSYYLYQYLVPNSYVLVPIRYSLAVYLGEWCIPPCKNMINFSTIGDCHIYVENVFIGKTRTRYTL